MNAHSDVLVVGSLNMDLVIRAPRLPRPGETLHGHHFGTVPGGKGANQAVAAARLGASVAMVGCVGDDAYGRQLRRALIDEGVDCAGVALLPEVATGIASIVVDDQGQNAITLVSGANAQVSPAFVDRFEPLFAAARVVICQLEIPMASAGHVLHRARALGKTVILNPAPALAPLPADWLAHVDYLIPNETEAEALTGLAVDSPAGARTAAMSLLEQGAETVLLTLGGAGVLVADHRAAETFPACAVEVRDSTGAGDTFVGGFAAALASGASVPEAVAFAQRAAGLSVTQEGAQTSIPTLAQVCAWASSNPRGTP